MTIGFYNPYFDGLGGGERYTLTLASHWSKYHSVSIFWDDLSLLKKATDRFNLDLSNIKIVQNIFRGKNLLKKLAISKQYDCIFFLSDGSIPTSAARYNILHFQVPFKKLSFSLLKMQRFQSVVCNSHFTMHNLDKKFDDKAVVIYPPVPSMSSEIKQKKKVILSVGRFSSYFQAKKQDVLINAFRQALKDKKMSGWKLVLAGGLLESDREYYAHLAESARGIPVDFFPNISFGQLKKLYGEASFYWHAAGFGETDPKLMEHFGISTVEAMSCGCIPLSYNGGGQHEIIQNGINGFLWSSIDELIEKTCLMADDIQLRLKLSKTAIVRAKDFSESRFSHDFDVLLSHITS